MFGSDTTTLLWSASLLVLILLILVIVLVILLAKSQSQSSRLLMNLLSQQTQENQSLRNQLRAADVVSLHGLNAATSVPPTQASQTSGEWIPTYDESIQFQQDLDTAGYGTQEPNDDLASRGWDPIVTGNADGGSPVRA